MDWKTLELNKLAKENKLSINSIEDFINICEEYLKDNENAHSKAKNGMTSHSQECYEMGCIEGLIFARELLHLVYEHRKKGGSNVNNGKSSY